MKIYNYILLKNKFKNIFSNMKFKDYITILLMILSITMMLIVWLFPIHPTEKIGDNPTISLHNALISQDVLYYLEANKESVQKDEMKYLNFDKNKNIFILKFVETDDSKRFIIVLLVDPNNIIRFSSIPFNENFTDDFNVYNLPMHEISNEKNIKIKIPSYDNYYIYGNWHLNVYIYNQEKELTAVISKPID